ncbi:MAG TPA: hypothetical protein VNJ10_14300 [Sphingomonas sp.]|nr:hypothetical protein [Sphingomonas sp.]
MLPLDLSQTLAETIDVLRETRDPWWIISSAAVALHGVTPIAVGDVDVLVSVADATRVMDALGVAPTTDAANSVFRSAVFGRWTGAPLVVEIMADFHVATSGGWVGILPRTRVPILVEGRVAHVPDREELLAMLRLFGRPKDLARAGLLTNFRAVS